MRGERLRLGMTVEEAAHGIGIPASLLRELESGDREMHASELVKLAAFYGCSPDFLLGLADERNAGIVEG